MESLSETTIGGDDLPARPALAPPRIQRGATVGRYVVLDQLGRGGMGVVYAAFDPQLDRKVALKLLHAQAQANPSTHATEGSSRLLREAQALAKLAHPNVITILDVGTHEGAVFLAMEFIEGPTLGDWAAIRRPWRELITMFAGAGKGLAAAHAASIIHRDFKPDNVMIGRDGRPRVLDFGLARAAGLDESPDPSLVSSSSLDTKLTMTGAVMGTPAYMAPEQHLGLAVDERSDQFSFCVAVYEALYGERPFAGDSVATVTFAVTQGKLREPPANSSVPSWIRKVLLRGLAREPSERYPSMDELLRELDRDPTRTRRLVFAGIGSLGVVLGLGFAGQRWLDQPQLCTGAEQQLIGVWDSDTRSSVHAAFTASEAPYAEAAFRGFSNALDDYTHEWTTMHTEACAATRIRGEQSDEVLTLRMTCLDRSRSQLSALVEIHREPDRTMIERSIEAAESLPSLHACADVEQLSLGIRPPETPALREQVAALRLEVDKARSLGQAGRTVAARERMSARMPEVDATGYRPLIAEAELARATGLDSSDQQRVALERAVWMAEASHHDRVAVDAWIQLIKVYGMGLNSFDQALAAVARADAAIERIGGDPDSKIRLDVAHGMVLTMMGRDAEGLALHRRARAARVAAGQGGAPVALNELVSLCNTLLELDDGAPEAIGLLTEGLQQAEPLLGTDHPWVARLRGVLGRALYQREDYPAAEVAMRTALAVFERANGKDSSQVAAVLNGLALVLEEQGRSGEALAVYQRALANFRTNYGPRHMNVAKTLYNIGVLERMHDDYEQAIIHFEEALGIKQELLGPDAVEVAWVEDELCAALNDAGRFADAVPHCRVAVAVFVGLTKPEMPSLIVAETNLAVAEFGLGNTDAARQAIESAHARIAALPEVAGEQDAPNVVALHEFEHAKLAWAWGDHAEARRLAEHAVDRYEAARDYYKHHATPVRTWLAEHPAGTD